MKSTVTLALVLTAGVAGAAVTGADGEVVRTKFTAELLTWGSH